MPRGLLVSRNFPPLVGGMERLNNHLLAELARDHEMYLIGPTGAQGYVQYPQRVLLCPARPLSAFLACAMIKAVCAAVRLRPGFVVAGSGANALPAWMAARLCGAKWGVYLHGLDLVVDNPVYRKLFLPLIRRADFWFANSKATADAAAAIGIDMARLRVVNPGVTMPNDRVDDVAVERWRATTAAGTAPIILSVGRLTRRKGLREFIVNAMPVILRQHPEAMLMVVGSEPGDALAADTVGVAALRIAAESAGVARNIRFLGSVDDTQLDLAFAASAVHVFPVLDIPGDMEGFGMVAIEAAARGVPTVAFAVGGVPDAVAPGLSGALVAAGDYAAFAARVVDVIECGTPDPESCRAFAAQFSWDIFGAATRQHVAQQLAADGDR